MKLTRLTIFLILFPKLYITVNEAWAAMDLHHWSSDEYSWDQDGKLDFVSRPESTYLSDSGDCEDYALVVLCAIFSKAKYSDIGQYSGMSDASELGDINLCVCGEGWRPTHVVVEARGRVYSSGEIFTNTGLEEFIDQTDYDWGRRRKVKA